MKLFNRIGFSCLCTLLLVSVGVHGQIVVRGSQTTNQNTGSSISVTKPSGLEAGDLLMVQILQMDDALSNSLSNVVIPTGWSLVDGRQIRSGGSEQWWVSLLYKVATSDDVAASNFTFTLDSDADAVTGSIVAFGGGDVTGGFLPNGTAGGPFDAAVGTYVLGTDNSLDAAAVTTSTSDAALVLFAALGDDAETRKSWPEVGSNNAQDLFLNSFNSSFGNDMGSFGGWVTQYTANTSSSIAGTNTLTGNINHASIQLALRTLNRRLNIFRSVATGNWSNVESWQQRRYAGDWVTPPNPPASLQESIDVQVNKASVYKRSSNKGNIKSHQVTLPANTAAGDLLILLWSDHLDIPKPETLTPPTGWTSIVSTAYHDGKHSARVWYKIADGSEGSSVTVTTSADTESATVIYRLPSGSFIGVPVASATTATNLNTSTPTAPALTTGFGNVRTLWIISSFSHFEANPNNTMPSGFNFDAMVHGSLNKNPTLRSASMISIASQLSSTAVGSFVAAEEHSAATIGV